MERSVSKRRRVSILFLGSTGAGPVYALEMSKALNAGSDYHMQIVVSRHAYNLGEWERTFAGTDVELVPVETYQHYKLSFALSLLEYWKVERIIRVIRAFNSEIVYSPFPSLWDFRIFPKLRKWTRIIASLHDPHPHDTIKNPLTKYIQEKNYQVLRQVSDIIVLNHRDVDYVKEKYCERVWVIPHASFSYYVRETEKKKGLSYTIGFLGRIEPYKGLDLLIDAFTSIKNDRLHLLIAGNGAIDNHLKQKIEGDKRIELINRHIEDEEFSGLLGRMDFVVLPYKRASQSGVIPMVFSHGKTVIVTNVGALTEQVPGETGVVVEATAESLKEAIVSMYDQPVKVEQMGLSALKYAKTELTWEHSAELLRRIIEQ